MLIVDAHLDLAYNALRGRDVLRPAVEQTPDDDGIPSVGLPDLRAGSVNLVCATIFCEPSVNGKSGYRTPEEARAAAMRQRDWYRSAETSGEMKFLRSRQAVELLAGQPAHPSAAAPASVRPVNAILLLEGADALRTPDDVGEWVEAGMRIVGLAWKRTRYAGGTGEPGPLSPAGVLLVRELDKFGVIHDASHLAEESFWQLLHLTRGPVIASHSNCRAFVPTDRQLSDDMIRAIVQRDGVIGINFFDKFLVPPAEYGKRRATLADVVAHMKHICDIAGDAKHVAIGTDMDGGLGREQIPQEIQTAGDLPKLATALTAAGFSPTDVEGIMGLNWVRCFQASLAG